MRDYGTLDCPSCGGSVILECVTKQCAARVRASRRKFVPSMLWPTLVNNLLATSHSQFTAHGIDAELRATAQSCLVSAVKRVQDSRWIE
jgi:hypothetical protein